MIGTPISKTCDKSLVHRGKITSIGQYYHVVFDDGDGNSHLDNLLSPPPLLSHTHTPSSPPRAFTPSNTFTTLTVQLKKKISEEDLSEDEALTCAKEYEQKFGAQHTSTSALRRKQRAIYENAGT